MSYEALLEEPEATIAQLCDQMGLTYNEEMLNIPHWGSSHSDVDDNQRGITRKANNHWQDGLTAGEVASIEKRCKEVMQAFGYEAHSQNAPFTWRQYLTFPIHLLAVLGVNPGRALTHLRALTGR